jgi:hypothetical protein
MPYHVAPHTLNTLGMIAFAAGRRNVQLKRYPPGKKYVS